MKIRILIKYYKVLQPGDAQCVFGQESDTTSDDSSHELQIRNDALEALRKIKHNFSNTLNSKKIGITFSKVAA